MIYTVPFSGSVFWESHPGMGDTHVLKPAQTLRAHISNWLSNYLQTVISSSIELMFSPPRPVFNSFLRYINVRKVVILFGRMPKAVLVYFANIDWKAVPIEAYLMLAAFGPFQMLHAERL